MGGSTSSGAAEFAELQALREALVRGLGGVPVRREPAEAALGTGPAVPCPGKFVRSEACSRKSQAGSMRFEERFRVLRALSKVQPKILNVP